jgi:heme ABC exporter ATP-binding subunit CcmA
LIELSGLGKRFGAVRALEGVSLQIDTGAKVAVLGANGSGKSTLLRIVAGLIRPTAGEVRIGGREPRAAKAAIGYLGHAPHLYPYLSAEENLRFYARLYGVELSRAAHLLDRVGLSSKSASHVRTLSRGEAQRLGLARCLLHDPDYLLLDEPLTGLDEAGVAEFPSWVLRPERTILMSTHDRGVVATLADRCVTLSAGRLQPS